MLGDSLIQKLGNFFLEIQDPTRLDGPLDFFKLVLMEIPQNSAALWKRGVDLLISLVMLLTVFPVMIVFAILVKLDSRGPVFYKQIRVGINNRLNGRRSFSKRRALVRKRARLNGRREAEDRRYLDTLGKPFPIYKFRTMIPDAEKAGPMWCQQMGDPRVTNVGNFLRKTHLDELPQLINILKGEMSVVGPRPERPEFVTTLTEKIPQYKYRLTLKPGLTGLAQIRQGGDMVIDDVKKKIRYDFLYMKKACLTTDLKIILGTVPLVLGGSMNAVKYLKKARRFLAPNGFIRKREITLPGDQLGIGD
jgi:lipopolysaccharide/colanic/teichoic acid biosynthesis glycosyltransferase